MKYAKCFLISLVVGLVFTIIYIIVKLILVYLKYKSAFNNVWFNTKYCGEKICSSMSPIPKQPKDINLTEWNTDIAKYSAETVYRIEKASQDKVKINYLPELDVLKELYNNYEDPVFGSIMENSNAIWISFRGTQTGTDFIQDLKVQQETYMDSSSSGQVEFKLFKNNNLKPLIHKGFMEIYDKFRKEILDTLEKYNPTKEKPIVVSGHSLGAAISTIVGFDLSQNNYSVVVYNYASPRIGDKTLCELINNTLKVFRVVNTADIVPNLPASVTPNFKDVDNPYIYVHCGILKSFTDNWFSMLNNHLIPVYMKALESM